jgi:hypothetical protein
MPFGLRNAGATY